MQEDTYWSNIFKKKEKQQDSIYAFLRRTPIFQDLSGKELKAVERILHRRTYKEDEVVFSENEHGVGMYIIESGQIQILLGKDKKVLAVLSTGDFFGEMAVILEGLRTASAVAKSPSTLLGFFRPDLFNLMETHPKIGNKILFRLAQMVSERLRISSIENKELKQKLNRLEKELAGTGEVS